MWTINDSPAYRMVSGWNTHKKLACLYCIENNKAFTLKNNGKTFFFTATGSSYQRITNAERIKMTYLLVELKGMFHCHFF